MFSGSGGSNLDFSELIGNVLMNAVCTIVQLFKTSIIGLNADSVLIQTIKTTKFNKTEHGLDSTKASMSPAIEIYCQKLISKLSTLKVILGKAAETSKVTLIITSELLTFSKIVLKPAARKDTERSSKFTSNLTSNILPKSTTSTESQNSTSKALSSEFMSNLTHSLNSKTICFTSQDVKTAKINSVPKKVTSNLFLKSSHSIPRRYISCINRSPNGRSTFVCCIVGLDARYSYYLPLFFSTDYFKSFRLSQYNFKYRLFIFSFKFNSITASNVCDATLLNLVVRAIHTVISFRYPMIVVFRSVISMPFFRFNYPISCCYCFNLVLLFLLNNDDVIRLVFFYYSVI